MVVAKRAAMGTGGALTVPSHSMSLVAGRRVSVIVMMGGSRAPLVAHERLTDTHRATDREATIVAMAMGVEPYHEGLLRVLYL